MKEFNVFAMFAPQNKEEKFAYYTSFAKRDIRFFGLQATLNDLLSYLDETFFNVELSKFLAEYEVYCKSNDITPNIAAVKSIHKQGYVGFILRSVEEFNVVKKGFPVFTMFNHHKNPNNIDCIGYIADFLMRELNKYIGYPTDKVAGNDRYSIGSAFDGKTSYDNAVIDITRNYYEGLDIKVQEYNDKKPSFDNIYLEKTFAHNFDNIQNNVEGGKGMVSVKGNKWSFVNDFPDEQDTDLVIRAKHGGTENYVTTSQLTARL